MSNPKPLAKYPFVSVIIPVYQQWDRLRLALDALARQTYPHDRFEIIAVNNERDPAFPDWIPPLKNLHLLHEPQTGSYAARNAGIKASRGDIIGFTDADCVPTPDWIERGIAVFQDQPLITRLAGNVALVYTNSDHKTAVELYESVFAFQQQKLAVEYGSAITANMFCHRTVFDAIGLFDEKQKSGGDFEWGVRAQRAGFVIQYSPKVVVSHPSRRTWSEIGRKAARVYGGRRALKQRGVYPIQSGTRSFGAQARVRWAEIHLALTTPILTNGIDRFKVIIVIVFLNLVKILEFFYLLLGGKTRRA